MEFEPVLERRQRRRWVIVRDAIGNSSRNMVRALRTRAWWRAHWVALLPYGVLALLLLGVGIGYLVSDTVNAEVQGLTLALTSGDQVLLRDYLHAFGAWGPIVSLLLMVLQVLVAPIPASVVQLANGIVYGQAWGTVLNIAGQMAGAMVAFSIARGLGKGAVERLAGQISGRGVETWLQRWGGSALFLVRAIPGMPSDFLSYAAGLTNMRVRTYVLVSFAGYIPQSFIYAWLGDAAMTWFWWIVAAGFGVSGIIAGVVWLIQRRANGQQERLVRSVPNC